MSEDGHWHLGTPEAFGPSGVAVETNDEFLQRSNPGIKETS